MITLTYNNDLSRIQIALTGLTDGTVQVERSTNQLFWQTVRGGVALPVSGGVANLDDFEFVPDIENFYRVISVDPPAGLLLNGTVGGYASTPDTAVLDITGDIDLRAEVTPDNWTPAGLQMLVAKYGDTANQRSYRLGLDTTGVLAFAWSVDGAAATFTSSTVAVAPPSNDRLAVRATLDVDNGAAGRTITFYTAPTLAGPWVQLGASVVQAGVTSIFAGTAALEVGARDGGTRDPFTGTIHAAEVRSGIDGIAVANPDFAAQPDGTTSFTDDAGRLWTVNGTAQIVGEVREESSITPNLMGQIWLKVIQYPFLNRPVDCINYGDIDRPSRVGLFDIKGRSMPVAVSDLRSSQEFSIQITTKTLAEARDMDLILAAGGTMLIHVPVEDVSGCGPVSAVPGGYVEIGDSTQRRAVPGSRINAFILPCKIVAPPGPDVIPTNLTWGTVFNLYGDWNALIAANPTWIDLLATVGSPEDLVVL